MTVKAYGRHSILDIRGEPLSAPFFDMEGAKTVFEQAAKKAGATVLGGSWHHFGEGYGYTGLVILAESHISCHVWPEDGYAAVDIFMCGNCLPSDAYDDILNFFDSQEHNVYELERFTPTEFKKSLTPVKKVGITIPLFD